MSIKSVAVYWIHTPVRFKTATGETKTKWPKVGAVVKTASGSLMGRFEMRPFKEWDGGFLLKPPPEGAPEVDIDTDEIPF